MTYSKQTWVDGSAGGTPLSAARLNYIESGIEATDAQLTSLPHVARWNGTGWRYRGATITVRPTGIPAWPDGDMMWDTSQHTAVTTPPELAIVGDKWLPHGSVTPSV